MANPDDEPPRNLVGLVDYLPDDMVEEILAVVPKRYHQVLSCVCTKFRDILSPPKINKIRSQRLKDSVYLCFIDKSKRKITKSWFKLCRKQKDSEENHLVSVNMRMIHDHTLVGFARGKIYVIGGHRGDEETWIEAESFDLEKQRWDLAPIPDKDLFFAMAAGSVDKKINLLVSHDKIRLCYDPRDGLCEFFEMPDDNWWRLGVCVIANRLYVYFRRFGLMWFDSNLKLWRVVAGLEHLEKVPVVAMAEYYGDLALLWRDSGNLGFISDETRDIWCRMIVLERSEEGGIYGTAGLAKLLYTFPRGPCLEYCLSVSD